MKLVLTFFLFLFSCIFSINISGHKGWHRDAEKPEHSVGQKRQAADRIAAEKGREAFELDILARDEDEDEDQDKKHLQRALTLISQSFTQRASESGNIPLTHSTCSQLSGSCIYIEHRVLRI